MNPSAAGHGRFVVLEGIDGSGKSTQARLLAGALRARGEQVVETREPGGTALGEQLRAVLLGSVPGAVSDAAEVYLFAAARAQLVTEVIRPALMRGEWVVCDRFLESSLVYQGRARGVGIDAVARANELAVARCVPDLVIIVDVPFGGRECASRRGPIGSRPRTSEFHRKVTAGYRELADRWPERVRAVAGRGTRQRRPRASDRRSGPADVIAIEDQPLAEKISAGRSPARVYPQQFLFYGPAGTGKRPAAHQVARYLIGAADRGTGPGPARSVGRAGVRCPDPGRRSRGRAARSRDPSGGRSLPRRDRRGRRATPGRRRQPDPQTPRGTAGGIARDPGYRPGRGRPGDDPLAVRPGAVSQPGLAAIAARLVAEGVPAGVAEVRARTQGPMALVGDAYWRSMREVGVEMGLSILRGDRAGAALVADVQRRMESAAAAHPSAELVELRRAADELEGKRGGRTAAKRAEDQEKRERRRMVSDGWTTVLAGAAGVVADGLALAVGAGAAVRHRDLAEAIAAAAAPAELCERALEEIESTRADLLLNPTVDLAIEALLVRINLARRGERHPLRGPGRMRW